MMRAHDHHYLEWRGADIIINRTLTEVLEVRIDLLLEIIHTARLELTSDVVMRDFNFTLVVLMGIYVWREIPVTFGIVKILLKMIILFGFIQSRDRYDHRAPVRVINCGGNLRFLRKFADALFGLVQLG